MRSAASSTAQLVSSRWRRILVAVCAFGAALVFLSATALPTQAATSVRTVAYSGDGVTVHRASGELGKLQRTSKSFRRFVSKRLNHLWGWTNDDPACAKAPLVMVKRWRSDGFARIADEGVFGNNSCARGGNGAIYVRRTDGRWSAPLGTQEQYYHCADLRKYRVPVAIGGRYCYDSAGQAVAYTGP